MRFFFLRAFRAYNWLLDINLARKTFPKAPEPRILMILKEEKLILFVVIWLNSLFTAALFYWMIVFLSTGPYSFLPS